LRIDQRLSSTGGGQYRLVQPADKIAIDGNIWLSAIFKNLTSTESGFNASHVTMT
jgi:hypothetical protein